MPTNFVKTLDTPNPEIAVNQLMTDGSLQGLAESVGPTLEDIAESRQEKADLESVKNFEGDYNTYQDALDAMVANADLARLEAKVRLDEKLRSGKGDAEQARAQYGYELDQITLREEQQGIVLEAEKRALVRKWTAIRPDLAGEFQKTLTINKSLQDLDQITSRSDKRWEKVTLMEAEARQAGVTLEHIMGVEARAMDKEDTNNRWEIMSTRGKIAAPAFDEMIQADWNAVKETLPILVSQFNKAILSNAAAAVQAQETLATLAARTLEMIRQKRIDAERMAREAGTPMVLDTSNVEQEIERSFNFWKNSLGTTGDTRNIAAINDMARDRAAASGINFLVTKLTGIDYGYYDPTGKMALTHFNSMVKALDSYGYNKLITELSQPGGLSMLVNKAQMGDVSGQAALSFLPLFMPRLSSMTTDPKYNLNPQQQALLMDTFKMISRGEYPSTTVLAQASPALSIIVNETLKQPDLSEESRKNLEKTSGGMSMMSYDTVWRRSDILFPDSKNAQRAKDLAPNEWNVLFKTHVESTLEPYVSKVDAINKAAITYDPNDKAQPFKIQYRLAGQQKDTQELVKEMNQVYTAIVNTRHNGTAEADKWAKGFMSQRITGGSPSAAPPVTSNAPGNPSVDVTEEMMQYADKMTDEQAQRFLNGEDPSVILKEQVGGR